VAETRLMSRGQWPVPWLIAFAGDRVKSVRAFLDKQTYDHESIVALGHSYEQADQKKFLI